MSLMLLVMATVYVPLILWYAISAWIALKFRRMSNRAAKIRGKAFAFVSAALIIGLALSLALDMLGGAPAIVALIFVAFLFVVAMGFVVRRAIDARKRGRKANLGLLLGGFATSAAILGIATVGAIRGMGAALGETEALPANRPALHLADIGVSAAPNHLNYHRRESLAVPVHYTYYETNRDGRVRTRIVRTIVPSLARLVFDGIRGESGYRARLSEKTLAEWKADDGYENEGNGTRRLLLYGKTVVEIDASAEEISGETMPIQLDALHRVV
jgi:hypothetical protein